MKASLPLPGIVIELRKVSISPDIWTDAALVESAARFRTTTKKDKCRLLLAHAVNGHGGWHAQAEGAGMLNIAAQCMAALRLAMPPGVTSRGPAESIGVTVHRPR